MTRNQIKHYREAAQLTQKGLAHLCGWGDKQSRVANYESGVSNPNLSDSRQIVSVFNDAGVPCTLDDVFPPSEADAGTAQDVA